MFLAQRGNSVKTLMYINVHLDLKEIPSCQIFSQHREVLIVKRHEHIACSWHREAIL